MQNRVISRHPKGQPLSGYDAVINPYQGCTFGCPYCYAATTTFTRSPSRSEDWGNWVETTGDAGEEIRRATPTLNGQSCYMAATTDPYQPIEAVAHATRSVLQALAEVHPKVRLVLHTRSPLVCRDLDLLEEIILAGGRIQVNMTLTTVNDETRQLYERECPPTSDRLAAIKQVSLAGIETCITVAPALDLGSSQRQDQQTIDTLQDALQHNVNKFIFQPFHFQSRHSAETGAAMRFRSMETVQKLLGVQPSVSDQDVITAYQGAYINGIRTVTRALEEMGAWVGTSLRSPF